jgi:regulator of sigma D
MKNLKMTTLFAALFLSTGTFVGCQDNKTNSETAEENLLEAQEDLNDVKTRIKVLLNYVKLVSRESGGIVEELTQKQIENLIKK